MGSEATACPNCGSPVEVYTGEGNPFKVGTGWCPNDGRVKLPVATEEPAAEPATEEEGEQAKTEEVGTESSTETTNENEATTNETEVATSGRSRRSTGTASTSS